jgi:ABC-type transporter Mla subunit MlaD
MRRLALVIVLAASVTGLAVLGTGASEGKNPTYNIRAIFDNAAFAVSGEDVRIAGANVGSIQSLDVTHDNRAAVTLSINNAQFTPFHTNATCAIRPQSLIGERYVDCEPGSSNYPALKKITEGPGKGTYYLPVTRTSSPIDSDIVQDIYQEPIRQRFGLILNELGTGLAARGTDLNDVIRRANPALGHTDQVLKILAAQNRTLANLARDSDTVLAPLAKVKTKIASFVTHANRTAVASAARAQDISRSFQLLPQFLRQLKPLLLSLSNLSDQGTPLLASLDQSATALAAQFRNLIPFAKAARPALIALGASSQKSQPALIASIPLAKRLNKLGTQAVPSSVQLDKLTASINNTGGIEQLMSLLYAGVSAANAFDADGHFVRAEPMVGQCTTYNVIPILGCSANFTGPGTGTGTKASAASPTAVTSAALASDTGPRHKPTGAGPTKSGITRTRTRSPRDHAVGTTTASRTLGGLLRYLIGDER